MNTDQAFLRSLSQLCDREWGPTRAGEPRDLFPRKGVKVIPREVEKRIEHERIGTGEQIVIIYLTLIEDDGDLPEFDVEATAEEVIDNRELPRPSRQLEEST